MIRLLRIPVLFHRAILRAAKHDCFNLAQSTAYSAMVTLFPALIVAAAVVSLLPYTTPLRFQLAVIFDRILPSDVSPLLESYFVASPGNPTSARALVVACLVSITGASGVISTLMEGVRRANGLPQNCWTFWQRRRRSLFLIPLAIIPFGLASLFVVFGHLITLWLALHVMPFARPSIYLLAIALRWIIALTGSIVIVALLYHMSTPVRQPWLRVFPGAVLSTLMWFVSTLGFGWYVTRFANYSQVYGSLGAGIALLFWLYIISFSVFCGAEFNVEFRKHFFPRPATNSTVSTPLPPPHG